MKNKSENNPHYRQLLIMGFLSFITMYILMYSMVNSFSNVYTNVNQFYMAGLMAMPMLIIEILVMRHMYMNKKLNAIIICSSALLIILFFSFIQKQTLVGDKQFLKSMIPHHAAAVLMVEQADLTDQEIKDLAKNIIESQEKEITQMKSKLNELNR